MALRFAVELHYKRKATASLAAAGRTRPPVAGPLRLDDPFVANAIEVQEPLSPPSHPQCLPASQRHNRLPLPRQSMTRQGARRPVVDPQTRRKRAICGHDSADCVAASSPPARRAEETARCKNAGMTSPNTANRAAVLPIVVETPGRLSAGSGFLLRVFGEVFLATVAHHATRLSANPDAWGTWTPRLHIAQGPPNAPGDPIPVFPEAVELFTTDALGARLARFRYVRPAWTPGFIADVILLPLDPAWTWVETVSVVDTALSAPPAVSTGGGYSAVVWGYPATDPQWPNSRRSSGLVVGLSGPGPALLIVDMPVAEGFSGAPVFTTDGLFLGMVIGETLDGRSHAQILTPGIIRCAATHTPAGYSCLASSTTTDSRGLPGVDRSSP